MRTATLALSTLLIIGPAQGGCGKARKEATTLKDCKSSRDCTRPNQCIRYAKGKGICARKCTAHSDCPSPLLCTGEYSLYKYGTFKVGRTRFFCRPANRGEGQSCANIRHGCRKGLACEAGLCYRGCATQSDCPQDKTCITLNKRKKVCLNATLAEGAPCKAKGVERCQRDLRCHAGKCVRSCSKARPCPPGTQCRGEAFAGLTADLSRRLGKPTFLFCIKAQDAKKEALASRPCQRHRNCAPPNHCVVFKGTGGVCMFPCGADGDCPAPFRCTGSYKPDRWKEKRVRLCRAATRKPGEPCGGRLGCMAGHRCYQSKCYPECKTGPDCPQDAKCIRIVFGIAIPGKPRPTAYRVCLPASGTMGQACKAGKLPYCQRKHRCHKDQCVRTCKKPGDCPAGKACKGRGYGWVGKSFKVTYHFCQ